MLVNYRLGTIMFVLFSMRTGNSLKPSTWLFHSDEFRPRVFEIFLRLPFHDGRCPMLVDWGPFRVWNFSSKYAFVPRGATSVSVVSPYVTRSGFENARSKPIAITWGLYLLMHSFGK